MTKRKIEKICEYLVNMRNSAVHGRINEINFELKKFILIEKVIYIMVLRKLRLNEDKIKLFLDKLFEN